MNGKALGAMLAVAGLAFVFAAGLVAAPQQPYDGPHLISGEVYTSTGTKASQSGAQVKVVVSRAGGTVERSDPDGLDANGWYSITLQAGEAAPGEVYQVHVQGSRWNDVDYFAEQKGNPGVLEFTLASGGSERRDVQALREVPSNLTPLLALVFALILFVTGLLFIGILPKQRLDVVVTGKHKVTVKTAEGARTSWKVDCGFGSQENPTPLGSIEAAIKEPQVGSLLSVSANKLAKTPEGEYTWHKPMPYDKPGKKTLASAEDVDESWFRSGRIQQAKGQSLTSAVRRYDMWMFGGLVVPFLAVEAIIGWASMGTKGLAIPPWGLALLAVLVPFLIGLIVHILFFRFETGGKKPVEAAPPPTPGPKAGKATAMTESDEEEVPPPPE